MIAESLISQIQIALIGIVVVVGLFFVWRTMSRLEEKLDRVVDKVFQSPACVPGSNTCAYGWNGEEMPLPEDADEAAEEFMRSVFGNSPMFSGTQEAAADEKEGVTVIEEATSPLTPGDDDVAPDADHQSEADTESMNPLSKSKLKKMNVDMLKDLCRERGMSVEGSKTVLMDRLLGLVRE